MNNSKIVVLVKIYKGELNPFDATALECALQTGSKDITVLSMSPIGNLDVLKTLTRYGIKAVIVSDKAYAGSDTIATSLVLAKALQRIAPDYVFCGRQSIDGDTAQVPPMLAERLGYGYFPNVTEFSNGTFYSRNNLKFNETSKTVLTFEKFVNLRFPSIFSKVGNVEVLDNSVLNIDVSSCGLNGSPTRVLHTYQSVSGRRFCKFVDFEQLDKTIKMCLSQKDIQRQKDIQQQFEKVFYCGDIKDYVSKIAHDVCQIESTTADGIAKEIIDKSIDVLLFSNSAECKELASRVAVKLNYGVCADCTSFRNENGKFVMTRPALGGDLIADIVSLSKTSLATCKGIQSAQNGVVFCIGNGAIGSIEQIRQLAQMYNAELCATRTVVDNGVMPYCTQVGLTGKSVAPKVYVCFGVSGAVQHTCAIERASTIIAINSDKNARIFDYADYGIVHKL